MIDSNPYILNRLGVRPILSSVIAISICSLVFQTQECMAQSVPDKEAEAVTSTPAEFSFAGVQNILFVLDCSHSMGTNHGKEPTQMDLAKNVIMQIVSHLPGKINSGLRVFGHTYAAVTEIDCGSTALLVPIGAKHRTKILEQLRPLEPAGLTPLSLVLKKALDDDFAGVQGRSIIILLANGRDTCGGNPVELLRYPDRFEKQIPVVVVSLNAKQDFKTNRQLEGIADVTHGKFYGGATTQSLFKDLEVLKN